MYNFNENQFNPNYINEAKYKELLKQKAIIEQQIKFEEHQMLEIGNMLKAINDYCDSTEKVAPQYQNCAFDLCVMEIFKRYYKSDK